MATEIAVIVPAENEQRLGRAAAGLARELEDALAGFHLTIGASRRVADPVELPVPTGLTHAGATAISDSGTVAGFGFNDRSEQLAVLWSCR